MSLRHDKLPTNNWIFYNFFKYPWKIGMGEIEKIHDLESRNLSTGNKKINFIPFRYHIIYKVTTALKEMIPRNIVQAQKYHSSSFKPNFKNLNLNF